MKISLNFKIIQTIRHSLSYKFPLKGINIFKKKPTILV